MNERLKKLRKALDLTQQEFGDRIGIKRNTLANYEIGRNEPIDAVINLICREFNVSETWLRTGDGEMFLPKADTVLEQLAAEHGLTGGDRTLIEKFLSMKPEDRRVLVDYVRETAAAIADQKAAAPAFAPAHTQTIEDEVRAEAEEYYRQRLMEKKQEAISSASQNDTGTSKMA